MRPHVNYDHAPFLVIWESTRACQLACRHCRAKAFPRPHRDQLSFAQGCDLMDQVRRDFGQPLFIITGGDPLMRDDLDDLVRYGTSIGLRVALAPSATPLLTIERLAELKSAGVQRIALSLDGIDAVTHDGLRGIAGTYERTIALMRAAQSLRLPVQINTSVGRHNADQLPALADQLASFGIVLWSVFILVPTGRARREMLLSPAEHEGIYRQLAALRPGCEFDIKTTAGQPFYRVLSQQAQRQQAAAEQPTFHQFDPRDIGLRAPEAVNDGKGICFVSHTGEVQPSGFLPLICGNVTQQPLAEIYRQHPTFRRLRDPDQFDGKCSQCEYNRICGGSRSRSYGLTGDPFASDPTCVYVSKRWALRQPPRPQLAAVSS